MNAKPFKMAVRAVILDEQGRCLMLRRSAINRHYVGMWEWLGGELRLSEEHDESAWVPLAELGKWEQPPGLREFAEPYGKRKAVQL